VKTVAIFVDVQNIYYTTRQRFSRHFDYHRFWAEVTFERVRALGRCRGAAEAVAQDAPRRDRALRFSPENW
jgi:uncharacterized LabA/DUF88 family protein